MSEPIGVVVMAYGGPDRLEDVEPYLLDIRGGRPTPPEVVEEVVRRYRAIGGRSPILEQTTAQAEGLRRALAAGGGRFEVRVGMRHWQPRIAAAVDELRRAGVRRAVGLAMAPHDSRMSIGAYHQALAQAAAEGGAPLDLALIESWKDDPGYLDAVQARLEAAMLRLEPELRGAAELVFTAHSLPERIREWDDPYASELQYTFEALRARFPARTAHFAYQSAAMTREPWLGPDAGDLMEQRLRQGAAAFVIAPIGFVCEHVEVLYDIDIEFRTRIERAGGRLERIAMPGDDPGMLASLARAVRAAAGANGWL